MVVDTASTRQGALKIAKTRRRFADNDINPTWTYYYSVKKEKTGKGRVYYAVIQTRKEKSAAAKKRAIAARKR